MANEVFIDSGHGGSDPGAVGNGVIERDKNLALAKYIIARLKAHGLVVRSDLDIGNPGSGGSVPYSRKFPNVKLFYSQHHNAASAAARGYEIYKTGSGRSLRFAKAVHARQLAALRAIDPTIPDRKVKEAVGTRAEYIVTRSQGSACLSEALFVSNAKDAAIAKRADYVERLGEATVRAIVEFGKAEALWATVYKPPAAAPAYAFDVLADGKRVKTFKTNAEGTAYGRSILRYFGPAIKLVRRKV